MMIGSFDSSIQGPREPPFGIEAQIDAYTDEEDLLSDQIMQCQNAIDMDYETIEKLEKEVKDLLNHIESRKSKLSDLESQKAERTEWVEDLKQQLTSAENRLQEIENEIDLAMEDCNKELLDALEDEKKSIKQKF